MADGVNIFMPFYVGDYLADTGDLSTEEHGAYMLLLIHMWRQDGSLTSSPDRLARITGVPSERWASVWDSIGRFFQVNDGTITNRRLAAELAKAKERKASAVARASAGGRAKRDAALATASSSASRSASSTQQAVLGECSSTSPSKPHAPTASQSEEKTAPLSAPPTPPEWALEFADRLRQLCHDHRGKHLKRFSDERYPKTRLADAVEIERIVTRDGRKEIEITQVFAFLKAEVPSKDNFTWREQVQSGAGLREKFEKIEDAIRRKTGKPLSDGLVQWYDPHKGVIRVTPQERDRLKAELDQAKADRHAEMYGTPAAGALAGLVSGIGRRV